MNYYKIDENGYVVMLNTELPFNQRNFSSLYLNDNEEIPEGYIQAPDTITRQLWLPRWTGTEWIEGKSKEEFEAEERLNDLIPTAEQIKNAEIEIKILTLLEEVLA